MNFQKITLFACALLFSITMIAQKPLPDAEVKTLEGETLNLQDLGKSGKITVISFWATWCKPCNNELDAIAELYEDWQEEYDMELVAITIDTRRAFAKVPGWVETKRWDYRVLHGNETEMQTAFNFQTIPQTILVDQNGNVVYRHNGYQQGDEIELEEKIAELAKK
ncbi:MAG: cytochrome c biogenesis protein CcmG/thiol:disulfide interchange protein DsbE [Paraglaciecola sp.]|jgi:cytochrome c biogenesis protein CcmG/thiol:disulfide interchange protein DsbE